MKKFVIPIVLIVIVFIGISIFLVTNKTPQEVENTRQESVPAESETPEVPETTNPQDQLDINEMNNP
jgi:uncharacterized protein YxeA